MSRILLILDHKENRRLLADALTPLNDIIVADSDTALHETFDLGIVDGRALDRLWEQVQTRKRTELPAILPFLLVTPRQDVGMTTRYLWTSVDEIIISPIEKVELLARVHNLIQARQFSLEFSRVVVHSSPLAIIVMDLSGRISQWNPAAERIFGWSQQEVLGQPCHVVSEAAEDTLCKLLSEALHGKRCTGIETRTRKKDGSLIHISIAAAPLPDANNVITHAIAMPDDITERKRAEEEVRESRERFRNLIEATSDWVWEFDENGVYTYASPKIHDILGYKPEEVLGKTPFDLMPPGETDRISAILKEILESRKAFSLLENVNLHKEGSRVVLETSGVPFFDTEGNLKGYRGINRDITGCKRAEETIRYQAYHDLPTGLPNREQLMLKLELELAQAHFNERKLAVLHIDLDRFKVINESLGHVIGDKVILAAAERLGSIIRRSDTLARIGSDEFIVLLADLNRAEDAALLANTMVGAMRKAFQIEDHELYVTVSIGISMYPEDSENAGVLLKNADIAVSHVKQMGRNNYQFFNPALNVRTVERLLLESDLRQSLERGELELHYQPQVNIRNREIVALEALVRWRHPAMGLLLPARFIPVAEEIGFIASVDEWVLRAVCAQIKVWLEAGYPPCASPLIYPRSNSNAPHSSGWCRQ